MKNRKGTLKRLRDQGFDLCTYDPAEGTWRVRCSQCEACTINGMACHETGCPNQKKAEKD